MLRLFNRVLNRYHQPHFFLNRAGAVTAAVAVVAVFIGYACGFDVKRALRGGSHRAYAGIACFGELIGAHFRVLRGFGD